MLFLVCCLVQCAVLPARSLLSSQVTEVADEAAFVTALRSGAKIIVVKNHLDLYCDNSDEDEGADKLCGEGKIDRFISLPKTLRAIVVCARKQCVVCAKYVMEHRDAFERAAQIGR
jgi:hypothetical protein